MRLFDPKVFAAGCVSITCPKSMAYRRYENAMKWKIMTSVICKSKTRTWNEDERSWLTGREVRIHLDEIDEDDFDIYDQTGYDVWDDCDGAENVAMLALAHEHERSITLDSDNESEDVDMPSLGDNYEHPIILTDDEAELAATSVVSHESKRTLTLDSDDKAEHNETEDVDMMEVQVLEHDNKFDGSQA